MKQKVMKLIEQQQFKKKEVWKNSNGSKCVEENYGKWQFLNIAIEISLLFKILSVSSSDA